MNILIDKIGTVFINGVYLQVVNTDFRVVLKYFKLLKDNRVSFERKLVLIRTMFFGKESNLDLSTCLHAVHKYVYDVYLDEEREEEQEVVYDYEDKTVKFDFEIDAEHVYTSFYQQYNIDLSKEKIDWPCFLALFRALGPDTMMGKLINLRTMPLPKVTKDNASYVSKLINAKKSVKIELEDQYG